MALYSDYDPANEDFKFDNYDQWYNNIIELCEVLVEFKEYKSAIRILNKSLVKDKRKSESYFLLGKIYKEIGELNKAEKQFRIAFNINKNNPEIIRYLGGFLLENGKEIEGLHLLCDFINQRNWNSPEILQTIYSYSKKYDISCIEKTLKVSWERSLDRYSGFYYALFLFDNQKYEQAGYIFRLIALKVNSADYWNLNGNCLTRQKKYEEAIISYSNAIEILKKIIIMEEEIPDSILDELNYDLSVFQGNISYVYNKLDLHQKALENSENSLRIKFNFDVWDEKVLALLELQKFDQVLLEYENLITDYEISNENFLKISEKLLTTYEKLDQVLKYQEIFEKILENFEEFPNLFYIYRDSMMYFGKKKKSDLIETYCLKLIEKKYLKYPEVWWAIFDSIVMLLAEGKFEDSKNLIILFFNRNKDGKDEMEFLKEYGNTYDFSEFFFFSLRLFEELPERNFIKFDTNDLILLDKQLLKLNILNQEPLLIGHYANLLIQDQKYETAKENLIIGKELTKNKLKNHFISNLAFLEILDKNFNKASDLLEEALLNEKKGIKDEPDLNLRYYFPAYSGILIHGEIRRSSKIFNLPLELIIISNQMLLDILHKKHHEFFDKFIILNSYSNLYNKDKNKSLIFDKDGYQYLINLVTSSYYLELNKVEEALGILKESLCYYESVYEKYQGYETKNIIEEINFWINEIL